MEAILALDRNIFFFTQSLQGNSLVDSLMVFLSAMGDGGAIWILTGLALILRKQYRLGSCLLISLALTFLINDLLLKQLVLRQRPFIELSGVKLLIKRPFSYSFPSGHSATAFASALAVHRAEKGKPALLLLILAFFIAVSRVFVGVHYPADVIAGMALGSGLGTAVQAVFYAILDRGKKQV